MVNVKNFSSSVYLIGTTCFNDCFLFHVITGRHYFSYKFPVRLWFFSTAILLLRSLKRDLKKVLILCYFHNNSTMLMPKFENKAVAYKICKIFLTFFKKKFWKHIFYSESERIEFTPRFLCIYK